MTDEIRTCQTCAMGKAKLGERLKTCMFCNHNPKAFDGASQLAKVGILVIDNWRAIP